MEQRVAGGRARGVVAATGTVGLLTYVLVTTDFAAAREAVVNANLWALTAAVVAFTVLSFLAQSASACLLLQRSGFDVTQEEFRRIRGASSLLSAVNYVLSLVTMTTLLSRRSEQGWIASSSPFFLLNFIDLAALSFLAVIALLSGASPLGDEASAVVALFAAGGLVAGPTVLAIIRSRRLPSWLATRLDHEVFSAFQVPSFTDLLGVFVLRLGCLLLKVFEAYAYLKAFGFLAPILALMVIEPLMVVAGSLPISLGGLGSIQVAARELLAGFAPPGADPIPTVDALSTSAMTGVLLVKIAIGLRYLPYAVRSLRAAKGAR